MPAAAPETAPAPVAAAPTVEKPHYPPFANFSALDMKGRAVSAHGLKGKINLICFWSPTNKKSFPEVLAVIRLYGEFHKRGVDALAVNISGNSAELRDTIADIQMKFPNVPNGYDVAARYNIDFSALPRTYVLNENFEIITSTLHGKALEDFVKKLLAEK
jgi:hypothetical protein